MKIIWSPAVTIDGYIAKSDGDSDWVSDKDGELFHELVKECGCVIVGRKTYEQYKGEVFPVEGATTFVWTREPGTGVAEDGVEFIRGKPEEVANLIEGKGLNVAVLAGGGSTNDAFVAAGLVDEVVCTIYPLMFGDGIKLLSNEKSNLTLELLETGKIEGGIVRNRYRVINL